MVTGATRFTSHEFLDKLRRDELQPQLTLTGMVKPADDDDTHVMFALGTQCADWTPVPLDSVETVEVLDSVPCKDHAHPLVTLTFTQPESREGAMFTALLAAAVKRRVADRGARPLVGSGPRGARARYAKLSSDVIYGPRSPNPGGCAAACNDYEIFEDGVIRPLVSCRDYGGGVYICYYD
jgi:hypothetical protein